MSYSTAKSKMAKNIYVTEKEIHASIRMLKNMIAECVGDLYPRIMRAEITELEEELKKRR